MDATGDVARGGAANAGGTGERTSQSKELMLLAVAVVGLASGGVLHLVGRGDAAHVVWAATTALGLVPAAWWVLNAARHRRVGVEALAVLALVGTLVVRENLAGAVITVMSPKKTRATSPSPTTKHPQPSPQPKQPRDAPLARL